MIIGLNIGHFGTKGAVGFLDETKCATEIYTELYPLLEKAGHTVVPCNDKTPPDYVSATKKANLYNLDLLISIHLNSSANNTANGTEVLYFPGSKTGMEYAKRLSLAISKELGTHCRGIKKGDGIYIIKNSKAPCVLLECLFVSSREDTKKYNAKKIAEAVAEVFGYKKPDEMKKDGLVSVNDIVWELSQRGIISNKELWLKKLSEDNDSYWLAKKTVDFIMKEGI